MTTYTIDTAAAIKRMVGAGLTQMQAQAIVAMVAERDRSIMTKGCLDIAVDRLEARLTRRIIAAQVATAALLFTLLQVFD